ncbi:MAG: VWA domain-containing protein [Byssovorax sp.]
MRRYLEPVVAFSAAAYLTLGCSGSLGRDPGGSEGTGTGGTGGVSATASGAGGAAIASETSDTAAAADPPKVPPSDFKQCMVTSDLLDPVFLTIPRARSMVTATQVRGELAGLMPEIPLPGTLRGPELLNYYHFDYPTTQVTEVIVVPELHGTSVLGQMVLQIGIQAPPVDSAHRRPTAVTVLVDTTKSMEGESMARANAAVLALAESLNKGDVLNLVTTNPDVAPVHRVAAIAGDPALFAADKPLTVSGAGDLGQALVQAYDAANDVDSYLAGGLNRLVVITDGGGLPESIDARLIDDNWTKQHIDLVGVGVGLAPSYRPALLDAATRAGHGANLYLDSVAEADAALHLRFDEVMDEALNDVSIGFQLPSIFEVVNPAATTAAVSEGQLTTSDLGRGRSMVFRHAVGVCPNPDSAALAKTTMNVTVSWNDPTLPDRQTRQFPFPLVKVISQTPSYAFLKTSVVVAFTNALQSLEAARFEAACQKIADVHTAYATHAADPELDSIAAQINAHPIMVKAGKTCP